MSAEEFYAHNVEPALNGTVTVDELIKALTDYRVHLETVWCDRVKALFDQQKNPHADDCACDQCMQLRYDGKLYTPPKCE